MFRQIFLWNWKSRAPPNFVGQIRSNLSFGVIWRSKKIKNANHLQSVNFFGCFWQIFWNFANLCKSFVIPRRTWCVLVKTFRVFSLPKIMDVKIRKKFASCKGPFLSCNQTLKFSRSAKIRKVWQHWALPPPCLVLWGRRPSAAFSADASLISTLKLN